MEKLLNPLQEFYGENRKFINENGLLTMTNGVVNLSGAYAQTYIISKQGGFIKWLVENEKVDVEKVKENGFITRTFDLDECGEPYSDLENLLMLLAIQDEPINFLISILK